MKNGLNEAVAKAIILAQVASDGGKGIRDIKRILPVSNLYYQMGYEVKDEQIWKAVHLILKAGRAHKECGFRFYVEPCYDFMAPCSIVYFDFRVFGEKYQVSFHTFDPAFEKYAIKKEKGYYGRWDHASSRNAVRVLKQAVFC